MVLSDCVLLFVLEIICETSWWSGMKMRTLVCQVLRGTTSVGAPQTKPRREGPWKPGVALAPFLGLLRDSSSELFLQFVVGCEWSLPSPCEFVLQAPGFPWRKDCFSIISWGRPWPCLLSFSPLRPPEPCLSRWVNAPRQERPLNSAFFPL